MGKVSHDRQKVKEIPEGAAWVPMTRELLESRAYQGLSINGRKFLDFLLIEHMAHAGKENGRLMGTYDQLSKFGLSRRLIKGAIREACERGLVEAQPGVQRGNGKTPSLYRLTFLKAVQKGPSGHDYFSEPTNEWKAFERREKTKSKVHEREPNQCTNVNLASARSDIEATTNSSEIRQSGSVHEGEPLIYLGPIQTDPDEAKPDEMPQTPPSARRDETLPAQSADGPHDPGQIDLEEFLQTDCKPNRRGRHDELRDAAREWVGAKKGRTLAILAADIGVSRPHLSNFLRGQYRLNNGAQHRLAEIVAEG